MIFIKGKKPPIIFSFLIFTYVYVCLYKLISPMAATKLYTHMSQYMNITQKVIPED